MKKGFGRASAVRTAGLCVFLIATMVSPEALAQGGRTAQARGTSTARACERDRNVGKQSTAVQRKSKDDKRSARAVKRKSKNDAPRARTVERKRKNAEPTAKTVERRQDRKKATVERRRNDDNREVARRQKRKNESVGRTGRTNRAAGTRATQDRTAESRTRRVERRQDGRRTVRGQQGSAEARKQTRVDRDGRDRRTAYRDRNRDGRIKDGHGHRSRYTGPRYDRGRSIRDLYTHRDRYLYHKRRHHARYAWCTTYHHPGHHHYVNAHVHIGSHVYLGISWPWELRFRTHWRPRFRYRQVVYVDAGWGSRRFRNRVELQTYYRHRVLFANDRYSEVEIQIDAIDIYENGRFLSTVDRIPSSLRKVRAIIHSDGRIEFDRNVFLMGDTRSGFEMIATRYYTDYLFDAYDRGHGLKVGRVNLGRGKVKKVRRSRFFHDGRFVGYAPISLLPDDDRLWDYGRPVSYRDHYGNDDGNWYRDYRGVDPLPYDDDYELSRDFLDTYSTPDGGDIRLERATLLERLD